MDRYFLAPLFGESDLPDEQTGDAYRVACKDPAVRGLAARCCAALRQLTDETGFAHYLRLSVEMGATQDQTPADWLRGELARIDSERDHWRQELTVDQARRRAELERTQVLRAAVGALATKAEAEQAGIINQIDALSRKALPPEASKYAALRDVGLSHDQIQSLGIPAGVTGTERQERADALRTRLPALKNVIAKCSAFALDPLFRPEHLSGLGLDDLIAASTAQGAEA